MNRQDMYIQVQTTSIHNFSKLNQLQASSQKFTGQLFCITSPWKQNISDQEFMSRQINQDPQLNEKLSEALSASFQESRANSCTKQSSSMSKSKPFLPPPPFLHEKQQKTFDFQNDIDMSGRYYFSKSGDLFQNNKENNQQKRQNIYNQYTREQESLNLDEHFIMAQSQAANSDDFFHHHNIEKFSFLNKLQIQQQEEFSYESEEISINLQNIEVEQEEKLDPIQFFKQNSSIQTEVEHCINTFENQQKIVDDQLGNTIKEGQTYKEGSFMKFQELRDINKRDSYKESTQHSIQQSKEEEMDIVIQGFIQNNNAQFYGKIQTINPTPKFIKHQINTQKFPQYFRWKTSYIPKAYHDDRQIFHKLNYFISKANSQDRSYLLEKNKQE